MAQDTLSRPQSLPPQAGEEHGSSSYTYGLRPNILGSLDTLAQSISCLAPTATPALLIPLVFGLAGNGTWLAYLIATISVLLVGANINQFASRSASPGSIYSYAAIGLGPGAGILTGWLLLCAYIVVISCLEAEFSLYAGPLIQQIFHLSIHPLVFMLFCSSTACYVAWRDIKMSASLMLILEICSISLILVLLAATLVHKGQLFDWQQISLVGVTPQKVSLGLVFAIFGYTGFESAASLGSEAKNPLKIIPSAIIQSGLWSGIFYIICAYVMILGFSGSNLAFDKCGTPLAALSSLSGVPQLGIILSAAALISFFACTLSCINTGSRLMFLMGHQGLFHSSFGSTHEDNRTPHFAVIIATALGAIPALVLTLLRCNLLDIMAWTGTIASYSFISSYALVCVAAPVYLYKLQKLKFRDMVIAVLALLAMCLTFFGNFDPNAIGIAKYIPYVFGALVSVGLIWYAFLKRYSPQTILSMTTDMEAIRSRFITNEQAIN